MSWYSLSTSTSSVGIPTCRERDVGHIEGFSMCMKRDVGYIEGNRFVKNSTKLRKNN